MIENAGEDEVLLHILYVQEPDYELQNRIYLFQGLPKADKMELIIQKAVELGAYSVVPVSTRRCVVKLDNKKAEKKSIPLAADRRECGKTVQAYAGAGGTFCDDL